MSISVIVPNLNTPSVDRTIAALEDQAFADYYEIIVVGMDEAGIVRESGKVRFDRSDNPLSPAQARNRGARQANGDVLAFTDADCLPHPDWLAVIADRFANPAVTVLGGGVELGSSNYWTLADNLSMFYEYLAIHSAGERRQLPSLNLAIRRDAFEAVGGFDERYPRPAGEDADLTIRLRRLGHRLFFEPRAVVFHNSPRNRLSDLLRHGYYQGKYSTKVDPRYSAEEGLPSFLQTRPGLILGAPFLAAAVTSRIFYAYPILRSYWRTAPAIYLIKLAWCFGAANRSGKISTHGVN